VDDTHVAFVEVCRVPTFPCTVSSSPKWQPSVAHVTVSVSPLSWQTQPGPPVAVSWIVATSVPEWQLLAMQLLAPTTCFAAAPTWIVATSPSWQPEQTFVAVCRPSWHAAQGPTEAFACVVVTFLPWQSVVVHETAAAVWARA
jgi:hypothetical protein